MLVKIGIIGAGKIGSTLAREFVQAGHAVRLANSRRPETISELADSLGAKAVFAREAAEDADVLVLSIQVTNLPKIGTTLANLPASAVLIDTSNYYPFRDVRVPALDQGAVESLWVSDLLGRPVVKAWNAIMAESLARKGRASGAVDRLAIPVAADDPAARSVALELVEASGFDALDAGVLADSWRFQPGQPAFCTDLPHELLRKALALADREKAPKLRDMIIEARTAFGDYVTADVVYLCRAMTRSPGRFHT
jgi:predicted dinucleotide-binding enzyme